jgi:metallo-beta-lactamase class B
LVLRSLILACVAGLAPAAALAQDPVAFLEHARKAGRWEEPTAPARIAGPVYFVGTRGLSVYLLTTRDGHVLINTGMPGSGPMIEASIRKLGLRVEDIRILLAGHAHLDHVGAHAYLKRRTGAKIAMLAEEKALLESGGRLDFHYGAYPQFAFEPAQVDLVLRDGERITLGELSITALLTAGHTRGAATFVTTVAHGERRYGVVFPSGTSINPGYRLTGNPSYPGIADDMRRTVRVLEGLKPDIWLHAHADVLGLDSRRARSMVEGVHAWTDPAGYRRWVQRQRAHMERALRDDSQETVR